MAKTRITVPEDHVAIVLSKDLAQQLLATLTILRRRKRMGGATYNYIAAIAGDVLLAFMDSCGSDQELLDVLHAARSEADNA